MITDFGHNNLNDVEKPKSWIEERNGLLKPILCVCDESIWEQRLRQREQNPLPNQVLKNVEDLKRHYANMRTGIMPDELVLDTTLAVDCLIDQAVAYVTT